MTGTSAANASGGGASVLIALCESSGVATSKSGVSTLVSVNDVPS